MCLPTTHEYKKCIILNVDGKMLESREKIKYKNGQACDVSEYKKKSHMNVVNVGLIIYHARSCNIHIPSIFVVCAIVLLSCPI